MNPYQNVRKAVHRIHHILMNEEDRDLAVVSCLARLGDATGVERITVYEDQEGTEVLEKSFHWEDPSTSFDSSEEKRANLNLKERVPKVLAQLQAGDTLQLPGDSEERIFLIDRGMCSALALPVILRGKFWGFLLLETREEHAVWEADLVSLLQSVRSTLGVSFLRWDTEEQLQSTNRELSAAVERARTLVIESERANAAKDQFLARMSHEIRTPMNGILGMARLLSYQEMPKEQREQIDVILQSGEMLLHIINDILDFSKIEAGKLQLSEVGFDLHAMLESVDALLGPQAQEKQISYWSEISPEVPKQVMGDSVRIRQILMNLIGNAIKFTSTGEVTIRTECLHSDAKKARIQFRVSDTGNGISPENIKLLFDEFSQVDESPVRKYEGSGLGLAIVRRLLKLMNGDIEVDSEVGKGSSFTVTMELSTMLVPSTQEEYGEVLEQALVGRKVLVVDDNENNLKLVGGLLDQWKCEHTETTDPEEALTLLVEAHNSGNPFLCAVIDMMMPKWDGVQLAQRIRTKPELAQTLLMVMLSSVDIREQEEELHKAGFAAVMQKPVHAQQLHGILITALYEHDRNKAGILVVDDDPLTLECTKRVLEREYVVYTAESPAAAETYLQGNHGIELLFCDHEMPGECGLDFCKRLQEEGSSVVRVLTTGYLDQDFLVDAINSQALYRYLVKPVTQELFLKTAHEALDEGHRRSQDKIKIAMSYNRTDEKKSLPPPVQKPEKNDARTPRVLLAEDNPVNQKVAVSFLKRLGVDCDIAHNGKEALDQLKKDSFDAVFMDLHMPEMDGLEATTSFREWEAQQAKDRVPIIALTADAVKGDREKCLQAGMDEYITKPLKLKSLQETLSTFFPLPSV